MTRFSWRKPKFPWVPLGLLFGLAGTVYGQLPHTQLTTVSPQGGKYGTTVEVRVSGSDLDEADKLFFSHPGITAEPKMADGNALMPPKPVAGRFLVQIDGSVPPGAYEARVVGRYGVSNPRAFVVGLFEEDLEGGGNHAVDKAKAIELDSTVNGNVDANARDYFRLSLKGGQRVLIDCVARRIDSRLDGTLVLYSPDGKELARSNGYYGEDPFLDFTAPQQGDYVLSLSDALYRGGAEYFYRMTTHLGPHLDFVFPPSGMPGSNQEYTLYGRNLPGGEPSDLTLHGVTLEALKVQIPLPEGDISEEAAQGQFVAAHSAVLDSFPYRLNTSNAVTIYFAQASVTTEVEPNNDASTVQSVTAPCEVVGRFFPARDVDWIQFEAKKGQVFQIEVFSHRLGLETDSRLLVQRITKDDKGKETVKELVNADDPRDRNSRINSDFDTSTDDPSYRLTADQDAIYRLGVWDQVGAARSDPRHVYRLVIREAQPDFRLVAVPQIVHTPVNANLVGMGSSCLRKGGTALFTIRAERHDGFAGDIDLEVEGLPAGVTTRGAWIAGNQTTTTLVFEAAEDAAEWAGTIRILGKARQGDRELERWARGGTVVWGTGNRTQQPPSFRGTSDIALAVMRDPAPTWVEVGENRIWETSRGGQLEIPVKVQRRREFKGDLKLVATGLPKELKPGDLTIKGDTGEAKLTVKATNRNSKPGIYSFYLRADTKGKFIRNPDAIPTAEQEQKRLAALVKELDETSKGAAQAQQAAVEAAAKAAEAAKQAEEAQTKAAQAAAADGSDANAAQALKQAEQELDAARKTAQAADAAKSEAEKKATDAAAKLKQAQQLKTAADKQLAAVKKANARKDVNFVTISTPVRLRVHDTPLKLSVSAPPEAVKQGAQVEIPIKLERLYGFADKVDLAVKLPKGVSGLEVTKLSLDKDAAEGKLQATLKDDATVGEHQITVEAKAKFNKLDVKTSQQVVIKVVAKS